MDTSVISIRFIRPVFFVLLLLPLSAMAERLAIPGTAYSLDVPDTFYVVPGRTEVATRRSEATIRFQEHKQGYEAALKEVAKQASLVKEPTKHRLMPIVTSSKTKLLEKRPFSIDGLKGELWHTETEYTRHMIPDKSTSVSSLRHARLVFNDGGRAMMVTCNYDAHESRMTFAAVADIFNSIRRLPPEEVNYAANMWFDVSATEDLVPTFRGDDYLIFTPRDSSRFRAFEHSMPFVVIRYGFKNNRELPAQPAAEFLVKSQLEPGFEVKERLPGFSSKNLKGYALTASGKKAGKGHDVATFISILVGKNRYYMVTGTAQEKNAESLLPQFQAIAKSVLHHSTIGNDRVRFHDVPLPF